MKTTSLMAAALAAGLVLTALPAGAGCGSCAGDAAAKQAAKPAAGAAEKSVTTADLAQLLKANKDVVVLDARAGKWDDGRRIGGAKALNADSTPEQVAAAVPDKDSTVVTYCSGLSCGASGKLAKHLRGLGYKNVIEYPEGLEGWTKAGNPVDASKK